MASMVAIAAMYVLLGARRQWDFETYYYAATAYRSGQNPYSLEVLSAVAGKPVDLPFVYPPITLAIFAPLSLLPIDVAGAAWLMFKCLLVVLLLWAWRKGFLQSVAADHVLAAGLFGFNLAILWDLRTGNVALVEGTLLWASFSAFLRDRLFLATCLIALASVFKLLPILFLGLLLIPRGPRGPRFVFVGLGAALLAGLLLLSPSGLGDWLNALSRSYQADRPMGEINPSALGLIDWSLRWAVPPSRASGLGAGLYALYCVALLAWSASVLARASSRSRAEQVMVVVLLWLLLSPRVMVYTYLMAVVPTLYAIRHLIQSQFGRAVALGFLLLGGFVRLLPGQPPAFLAPLSFFLVLFAWTLFVRAPRAPQLST